MIHPDTELRFVSDEIGYGVFATKPIPKGTIVYIKDSLEIEITKHRFSRLDSSHKDIVEKYSYIDERGVRIVSWDHAKYINHKCDCNSMSTGYGFEIAIRDIAVDEEITDEYGLFNIPVAIEVNCGCVDCRKILMPTDIDTYANDWDSQVMEAINNAANVDQPLWDIMDMETRTDLMSYLSGQSDYRSVADLKYESSRQNLRQPKRASSRKSLKSV
ncbi:MAG: SET domain-containing protein [Gammaproteobacteria bacterium]|nr:SET domain-containing protein [Gammaproteobacteria bacterium]